MAKQHAAGGAQETLHGGVLLVVPPVVHRRDVRKGDGEVLRPRCGRGRQRGVVQDRVASAGKLKKIFTLESLKNLKIEKPKILKNKNPELKTVKN